MSNIYIHYGASKYDPDKFKPIKNELMWTKPEGGLWASPKDASFGWKEWCESSEFKKYNVTISFEFTLAPSANVMHINNTGDLTNLPKVEPPEGFPAFRFPWVLLDFEKLAASGVDAIQVNMSSDNPSKFGNRLHYSLNGWDCDSILVMNKDVVVC